MHKGLAIGSMTGYNTSIATGHVAPCTIAKGSESDVYCDQFRTAVERGIGMRLSLGTMEVTKID